jgi:signal transduction histidine kinase
VASFALLWLISLDAYYFSAFAASTHNASYAIGVMCAAVFFLLPPAVFLPVLGLNHGFYCARLLLLAHDAGRKVAAPLIDGTVCMAVAGLGSWFLFHAARENFLKERIIVKRNEALAASNEKLREIMAIAAHDLRSPLLGVRDLLALGRSESTVADGSRLGRILDQAVATCGGLVRLVSRLVEAHAAEEAQGQLPLVAQDLGAACTAAVERLRATAEAKGQRIALALPDEAATAKADATALAQVLENLLGNALKFSPRDSQVELALAAAGDGAWQIKVRDAGPGVPAEERAQLGRKFFRGSPRPTGGESSTGLGLHIVKTLTEAMGGRVSYAPGEAGGSVFRIELPRG